MKNSSELQQPSYFSVILTNLITLIEYPIKHPVHALTFLILTNQVLEAVATLPKNVANEKQKPELKLSAEMAEHLEQISATSKLLQDSFIAAAKRGDYKTANQDVDDLLKLLGPDEILVESKVRTSQILDDTATAYHWAEKLYEINQENELALALLVQKYSSEKNEKKTKHYGQQLEKITIETAQGYFARSVYRAIIGESPFSRELFKKAIEDLTKAEELAPGKYYVVLQKAEQRYAFLEKAIPSSIGLTNDIAQVNYVIPLSPQAIAAFQKDARANFEYDDLNKAIDENCGIIFATDAHFMPSIKDRTVPAIDPSESFVFLHKHDQFYLYIASIVGHELQIRRTDVVYSRSEIKRHFLVADTAAILTPEGDIYTESIRLRDYLKEKQDKNNAEHSTWFNQSTVLSGLITLGALAGIPYFIRQRKNIIKQQELNHLIAEEEKSKLQQTMNNNKSNLLQYLNACTQNLTAERWQFKNDIFSLNTNQQIHTLNVQENPNAKLHQLTEITIDMAFFRSTLLEKIKECFSKDNVVMINNVLNIKFNLLENPDKAKIIRAFDNAIALFVTNSIEYTYCSKYIDAKKAIEKALQDVSNKNNELMTYIQAVRTKAIKAKKENASIVDKADELIFDCDNSPIPILNKDNINAKLFEAKKYINQLKRKAANLELQQTLTQCFNDHEKDIYALNQYMQAIKALSDTFYAKEEELNQQIVKVELSKSIEDDFIPGLSKEQKKEKEKSSKPEETPEEKATRLQKLAEEKAKNTELNQKETQVKSDKPKSSGLTLYGFIPTEQKNKFDDLLRDQVLRIENRVKQINKKELDINSPIDALIATRALLYNFLRMSEALREKMYWCTVKPMDVLRNGIMKNVFLPNLANLVSVANKFIEDRWVDKILEHLDTGKELSIDEWVNFLTSCPLYHYYNKEYQLQITKTLLDFDVCMQYIFNSMSDLAKILKVMGHEADLDSQPDRSDAANHCVMTIGHCAEQLKNNFPDQFNQLIQDKNIAIVFNKSMQARKKIGHAPSPTIRTDTWKINLYSEDFMKHPSFKVYENFKKVSPNNPELEETKDEVKVGNYTHHG